MKLIQKVQSCIYNGIGSICLMEKHDGRAPDTMIGQLKMKMGTGLNGDILVWDNVLGQAELASMGIRVDKRLCCISEYYRSARPYEILLS